jgi:hypothetical protein
MTRSQHYLTADGVICALISALHMILALKPALYRYISAGQQSALVQMAEQGSGPTTIATVALALIFAVWAVYAFSGARLIGRLPLMRAVLITIAVIHLVRALALPSEINMALNQGYPVRFSVYSVISLVAGMLFLIGVWLQRGSALARM